MNKKISKISTVFILLLIVCMAMVPEVSMAWIDDPITSVINAFFSNLSYIILQTVSYIVLLSGVFLNQSINLTTHIGDIFNSIPALQEIWIIVRNLSSIFIIFMLLYSSITTILGVEGPSMKNLIKNIVMAGLLINFSLFFVKIGIDASNLISLQFYRAIAPGASESTRIGESFTAPGLSNVFMSSLKIPKIYQNNGITKGIDVTASIGLATVMGTIVMITAALSFFAAAIMFSIRTAILIFVMALSPVFFAGMIFPAIKKEVSDKLLGILKNQLIFMPAYLFLMYVSLKFISSEGFTNIFNAGNGTPLGGGPLGIIFIGVLIQYIIALLFINAPLVFAIQLGGIGAKWVPGSKGVGDVAKWFGTSTARNTLGRAASRIGESERFRSIIAETPIGGLALSKAVAGISGASFGGSKGGYDAQVKADAKAMKELNDKIGKVNRLNYSKKEDYDQAVIDAKKLKAEHRDSMSGRSLWGRMKNSRGTQQAYETIVEAKDKEDAKNNKKKHEDTVKENNDLIKGHKEKLKNNTEGPGFAAKPLSSSEKDRLNREIEEKEKENEELIKKIALADKASEEDLIEKFRKMGEKDEKPPREEGDGKK